MLILNFDMEPIHLLMHEKGRSMIEGSNHINHFQPVVAEGYDSHHQKIQLQPQESYRRWVDYTRYCSYNYLYSHRYNHHYINLLHP